jgi:serine/threonine-protein kinase
MSIQIGQQLGSLEITALLGKGGMGEVYRARDTKLKRDVAIKILPDEFARDADRVARFQREAEVLASLSHQNIAGIYDLQHSDETQFLVMELVEGETLADRIKRGPLPVEEALKVGKSICEALEAAHEKGIVHRDLKPANVKITADGTVKVLDFGLAKIGQTQTQTVLSSSPTLLSGSMPGRIMGTAAYMSPEQARGRDADHQSDIFSFGCLLYEMLTGRPAFDGETVTEILASVLKQEPDLSLLPQNINSRVVELIRRCLAKDPKKRWHSAADVGVEIETIVAESLGIKAPEPLSVQRRPLWKRLVPIAVTAALIASLTAGVVWVIRPKQPTLVSRFSFVLPDGQTFTRPGRPAVAFSPDGENIVYQANRQLYLRPISDVDSRPIDGTNQDAANPFFSPDGRWIGFFANTDNKLKKISITGGTAVTICDCEFMLGASWTVDNQILYASPQKGKGIFRVSANGGKPELVVAAKPDETMVEPQLLPDGDHVLYTVSTGGWDKVKIVVESLKSHDRKILVENGAEGRYLPTGHVMYALRTRVFVVPFNAARLAVTGEPVSIIEDVGRINPVGAAQISFANNGSMVYVVGRPGGPQQTTGLAWVDRSGKETPLPLPPGRYSEPRISPDGRQIAVLKADDQDNSSLWVYDVSATIAIRPLTFDNTDYPVWTRDSQRIIFRSNTAGGALFWQQADGKSPAEELEKSQPGRPNSVSPDGKNLVFTAGPESDHDLWVLSLIGDHTPKLLISGASNQEQASFSPDGRWIVYSSPGAGIYVQLFPLVSGVKYQITIDGFSPLWSPDGKQIFYLAGQIANTSRQFTSVDVRTEPTFAFANPTKLLVRNPAERLATTNVRPYDITPDGKQFLIVTSGVEPPEKASQVQFRITLNWFEELKQRVPIH